MSSQSQFVKSTHAGDSIVNPIQWDKKKEHSKDIIIANFEALGLDGAVFTAGKSGKIPYGQIKKYLNSGGSVLNPGGGGRSSTPGKIAENLQFYYHPDHLGSSNYITDATGEVYQHEEYFPFGETFVEERNSAEYTTYLFNGKELDEETGLYYYGARYYDPRISIFNAIDPLTERYPNVTSYAYVANNPLRFIDINGLGPGDRVKTARNLIGTEYKQELVSSLRTANSPEALRYMDCAEFVCRVMSSDKITDGVKHMAGSDLKSFLDDKKKFEFSKTPKTGDIALWKGHVGIVTEIDKDGNIKLTHARGVGKLAKENSTFISPEEYAPDSKFYGYYRPIEETRDGKLDGGSSLSLSTTNQPSSTAENSTMYFGGMLPEVIISAKGSSKIKLDIKGIIQSNE